MPRASSTITNLPTGRNVDRPWVQSRRPRRSTLSEDWTTTSGIPLQSVYGPGDVPPDTGADSMPGRQPFLRGAYPEMYRSKPWRIFQLSGHGNPEDERDRIRFLLDQGETGFIMEHDRNTADHLYNVDHPEVVERRERRRPHRRRHPERRGLRDHPRRDRPRERLRPSRWCRRPACPVRTRVLLDGGAAARHRLDQARRNRAERLLPDVPRLHRQQQVPAQVGVRLNSDIVEFCGEHLPRWVPISIAAYNAADTGLNAFQELAVLFANAVVYLDEIKQRNPDALERLAHMVGGINLRVSMDLFEDICKLRAARKMWSDLLKRRYGITDEKATRLRIHIVTAGSAMTYQQPLNNIVRGTLMALASVLGGTQSLGVSGYDEGDLDPLRARPPDVAAHPADPPARDEHPRGRRPARWLLLRRGGSPPSCRSEHGPCSIRIEERGGFIVALDDGWLHAMAAENQYADASAVPPEPATWSASTSTPTTWRPSRSGGSTQPRRSGSSRWTGLRRCGPAVTGRRPLPPSASWSRRAAAIAT